MHLPRRISSGTDLVKAEGVIADTVPLDPKTAEKLKAEESYYTKVLAAAHNSIGAAACGATGLSRSGDAVCPRCEVEPEAGRPQLQPRARILQI